MSLPPVTTTPVDSSSNSVGRLGYAKRPLQTRAQRSVSSIMVSFITVALQIPSNTNIALQSEYWVSHKKYWCKYCEIFIADDAPSRTQHENGLRHQGNKERFIRNLYKTGQKRKQDQDEETREMARIDQVSRRSQHLCDTCDQCLFRRQERPLRAM